MSPWTRLAGFSALIGALLWFVGNSLAIASFNQSNAVPYSIWNHTISELGFPRASSTTWLFNATEVLVGLMLLPTYEALRRALSRRFGSIAAVCGFVTWLTLSAVGILGLKYDLVRTPYRPLPFLMRHNEVAAVFFLGWLATVALFTNIFIRRWRDPYCRLVASAGIACLLLPPIFLWVAVYADPMQASLKSDLREAAIWNGLVSPTSTAVLSPWWDSHRPRIWWPAVLEWSLAGSIFLWHGTALLFLWLQPERGDKPS
jgi:hypothetical protein